MADNNSFLQINKILQSADMDQLPDCRFLILRNITAESIDTYYRFYSYESGLKARLSFGGYNTVLQDAIDGDWSEYQDVQYVSIFTYLKNLSLNIATNFNALNIEQVAIEVEHVKTYIHSTLIAIREKSQAVILWHGFDRPVFPASGIYDSQKVNGQAATIDSLNRYLLSELNKAGNAYFVDINMCLSRIGEDKFYDSRFWYLNQSPILRLDGGRSLAKILKLYGF